MGLVKRAFFMFGFFGSWDMHRDAFERRRNASRYPSFTASFFEQALAFGLLGKVFTV